MRWHRIGLLVKPMETRQYANETAYPQKLSATFMLRRSRSNHAVDGTITSAPSHAIWRTVPPATLINIAEHSHITAA